MARGKAAPDFKNIGSNPLANDLQIKVNKKIKEVVNKFGDPDKLVTDLEGCRFLKLFEVPGFREKMMGLNMRAKEMLLYILHNMKPAADYIWIDRESYMKEHGFTALNTFKKAIKVLCDERYIYPHHSPEFKDVYWTNPKYFFKGDRLKKYPNKVIFQTQEEPSQS